MEIKKPPMRVTTVRLPVSIWEGLQIESTQIGKPIAEIIREGVRMYDIQNLTKK